MVEHQRISVRSYDELLDILGALVVILDRDGAIVRFNSACERLTGYREHKVLGRQIWDFLVPEDEVKSAQAVFADLIAGNYPNQYENHWVTLYGDRRLVAWSSTVVPAVDGGIEFVIATGIDVTEKSESQRALQESEALLQSTVATSPMTIVKIETDGTVAAFNPAAERLFGYSEAEMLGKNVSMLMPAPYQDEHDGYLERYLKTGEKRIMGIGREVEGRKKNGETFPLDLAVGEVSTRNKRFFTGFIRDLSDRRSAEEAIVQAEGRFQELQAEFTHVSRLSAMGEMATSLAHEINQPLATIMNYLQACNRMLTAQFGERSEEVREFITKASDQAYRAGQIIKRLRDFAERGETERNNEDINEVISEASTIALTGAQAAGVEVSQDLAEGLPKTLIDRIQIQQVVVNFIRNSLDAMAESGAGSLKIATERASTGNVVVSVSDDGPGIADEISENLFLPFNTTKADGLGIGLSVCQSIIESHGGRIWAEPHRGAGVTFSFSLPPTEQGVVRVG